MGVPTSPCELYLSSPHPTEGLVNHINSHSFISFLPLRPKNIRGFLCYLFLFSIYYFIRVLAFQQTTAHLFGNRTIIFFFNFFLFYALVLT